MRYTPSSNRTNENVKSIVLSNEGAHPIATVTSTSDFTEHVTVGWWTQFAAGAANVVTIYIPYKRREENNCCKGPNFKPANPNLALRKSQNYTARLHLRNTEQFPVSFARIISSYCHCYIIII